jgi:S-adenosylmethionine hydrolase
MSRIVTLLTDFGTADGYVGEMKGVLLSSAPGIAIVDVAHDISPQDVDGARLALARYWRRYPAGTVHLAVVDPGVGSSRAALAVESEGRFLVGPDNGVLSPALLHPAARCIALVVPTSAAPTFHGRDVFAPAAAALASGAELRTLGTLHATPVVRRTPEPTRRADGALCGVVIAIDRFGNAVTNLMGRRGGVVVVGDRRLTVSRTYSEVEPGAPVALVGSSGLVEIAIRDGSAARDFGLQRGSAVTLVPGA